MHPRGTRGTEPFDDFTLLGEIVAVETIAPLTSNRGYPPPAPAQLGAPVGPFPPDPICLKLESIAGSGSLQGAQDRVDCLACEVERVAGAVASQIGSPPALCR